MSMERLPRRVRCPNHAMAPTKRTAVVPQAPVHGIDLGAIDDSKSATMTSALIFLHFAFLAIDRILAMGFPGMPLPWRRHCAHGCPARRTLGQVAQMPHLQHGEVL